MRSVERMKLDMTEEEFVKRCIDLGHNNPLLSSYKITVLLLKELGVTFNEPIDWEAETHDPSVIPENWLVENWDNGDTDRWVGFLVKKHNFAYDNFRAIKKEDWPKWAIEALKSLED